MGIPILVAGLASRRDPALVVLVAALAAGVGGGLEPLHVVSALGKAYNQARFVSLAFLVLPVVGLAERAGLQARAGALVRRLRALTVGRFLIAYLALRQVSAAIGLVSLGGQATMVRPLIAPMAQGLARTRTPDLDEASEAEIRAQAAAADTIGVFFGEDIFVALGAVLLIVGVLQASHVAVRPAAVALWGLPTAGAAFVVHALRLARFDARLAHGRR